MSRTNCSWINNSLALPKSSERFEKLIKWTYGQTINTSNQKTKKSDRNVKKNVVVLQKTYKRFILRVKKLVAPKMILGSQTLKELDDLIVHVIDLLQTELSVLYRKYPKKTLDTQAIDTAIKMCFPTLLANSANEFGNLAVYTYFQEAFRSVSMSPKKKV
ncbi:hypothetical protein CDAR_78081 [Caerostris darwini]|uniref:Histone H2A/H2B/H3 domain-containing protein n=1 Tax=Caerostris darwini TaxID=1538125 RepID=A0AAV4M345_9ARAC|nr:hypothetical protein CDAR_78081 [Caerostris darwini]